MDGGKILVHVNQDEEILIYREEGGTPMYGLTWMCRPGGVLALWTNNSLKTDLIFQKIDGKCGVLHTNAGKTAQFGHFDRKS